MTVKDKEKFEILWKKLEEKVKKELDDFNEKRFASDDARQEAIKTFLLRKIMGLEKLVYFLVLALAGEGFATPELKETMCRLGLYDLFEEGLK